MVFVELLAERLKTVINKLVNKHQMAFIQGRQIIDSTLITSECVDKGEVLGIMCKLDIEKDYDHVKLGIPPPNSETDELWREMAELDMFLHQNCQVLNSC